MNITKLSPNWAVQMGPIHFPNLLLFGWFSGTNVYTFCKLTYQEILSCFFQKPTPHINHELRAIRKTPVFVSTISMPYIYSPSFLWNLSQMSTAVVSSFSSIHPSIILTLKNLRGPSVLLYIARTCTLYGSVFHTDFEHVYVVLQYCFLYHISVHPGGVSGVTTPPDQIWAGGSWGSRGW